MTKVIFSFDIEDYINSHAADGVLWAAQLLRREGIRGSFNTAGMFAQALEKWGRQDIISELRDHHELTLHSHRHSMHPTINEYTDVADPYAAIDEVIEDETVGLEKLCRVFGVAPESIKTACPPGLSTSYAAHYAYAKMGFTIYDGDTLYDAYRNRPLFNCNIASLFYNTGLISGAFKQGREHIKEFVEQNVFSQDIFIFYHHPAWALIPSYCDLDNFNGVNTPSDRWILEEKRPEAEIQAFYENFQYLVELLKKDPRCEFATYGDIAKTLGGERVITKDMIPELRRQLDEELFPVTTPDSFSLSDIALACRDFLLGKEEHVCSDVYGFLATPHAATAPVTLSAEEVKALAKKLKDGRFLPEFLWAGDQKIGPADWLRAALAILDGEESYTVEPNSAWQIDLDQFPEYRDTYYNNRWIHCKEFEDRYLADRFRLQSWTIRLPKGTDRFIFPK
ncbi:MAG: hypothetical protein IKB75_06885 [Clostridia bacterium]|nr:hypothetical protein [Clostridia bacterium]